MAKKIDPVRGLRTERKKINLLTSNGADQDLYKKIPINNLIVFCIYSINERKEQCDFEKLAKECFNQFPKTFSFSSISKWPDSRKLDRPLRTLRNRKIIKGNVQTNFSLTKLGRGIAEQTAKTFGQRKLI